MKATHMVPALTASARKLAIAGGVAALHLVALWWLQVGLAARMPEKVLEIDMLSEMIEPPKALPMAAPPPRPAPVVPQVKSTTPTLPAPRPPPQPPLPRPAPTLLPVANAAPSPNAPVVDAAPPSPVAAPAAAAPNPPAPPTAPTVPAPQAPPAPPASPRVELPSTDANYLNNPKPAYPTISRRLGEQGKVLLRVVIAADGSAQKVELQKSSGYERLDQAAVNAVQQWRFVPGKRNGVAETMAHTVPIQFSLE